MNFIHNCVERGFSTSKLVPLRLSNKTKFGAVSKTDFKSMIYLWKCAKCSFFPCQRGENGVEKTLFVLTCGHYICKRCRDEERKNVNFECQLFLPPNGNRTCDKTTDLSYPIPLAIHVIEMRWMLSERGFPCHVCRSETDHANFFSRDLVHVCVECSVLSKDNQWKWANGRKIFEDPRRLNDFEDHKYKYALLCLFCARVPSNIHGSHLICHFDEHSIRSQVTLLCDEDKAVSYRPKWNLSMLSREMADRLLRGYLTCHCGFEYSSNKCEIKPVMLGCNHIVCSKCAEPDLIDIVFQARPRCPVCAERIKWKSDPLQDLEFASLRMKGDYRKCEVCCKLYPQDRSRICGKQFREKATDLIVECPNRICFDCVRTSASKKHHRNMSYRGIN